MADANSMVVDVPGYDDPNVFHLNRKGGRHPDLQSGEMFLGYRNETGLAILRAESGYTTLRKGVQVVDDFDRDRTYDARGEFFPVFVQTSELNDPANEP